MPVPTNLSAATAIVITTLPYSITLDAHLAPADALWFRYDKPAGGYIVLALAAPLPLMTGTYLPQIEAWTGTPDALTPYLGIQAIKVPVTTPLETVITSYYFSVEQTGGAFTEQLAFSLEAGPVAAAPAGSFAINDDTDGFPMAIVSSADGSVLQSFPFPAGERAAMLASGVSLWHDQVGKVAGVYSAQFALAATVAWSVLADHDDQPEAPMSATATQFYLADRGRFTGTPRNAQVTTVSATGVLGPTVWDLGAYFVWSIAPSLDDAILYYTNNTTNAAIKRWDLVGDVAMADLVAAPGVGTSMLRDILVMADGSVVTGYRPAGADYVRRYSAAGATLNTYTMSDTLNRIAHAGDGTSFWAWSFLATPAGTARFDRIRASDGVVLATVDGPTSTGGVWEGVSPGTPTQGLSTSCPFVPTTTALAPITFAAPEPTYRTRNVLIRRLRQAPHLSNEQKWSIHHRLQLDLQTGVGLNDGQGEDPQLMLQWSDDGGHTWSDGHWRSAGRMGEYTRRALWRRLGRSRDRIYRVTVSDPVAWHLLAAYLDVAPGTH